MISVFDKYFRDISLVMYGDVINGMSEEYLMTWDEVVDQVKEYPFSTDPDEIFIIGTDGTAYSLRDIADTVGIELQKEA